LTEGYGGHPPIDVINVVGVCGEKRRFSALNLANTLCARLYPIRVPALILQFELLLKIFNFFFKFTNTFF
jgi:hypothetical protein